MQSLTLNKNSEGANQVTLLTKTDENAMIWHSIDFNSFIIDFDAI